MLVLGLVLGAAAGTAGVVAMLLPSDHIAPNVWVGSVAIGDLSPAAAESAIEQLTERTCRKPLLVKVGSALVQVQPRDLDCSLEARATIERASAQVREAGWIRGVIARAAGATAIRVAPIIRLDAGQLARLLPEWEARGIADRPHEGGLAVEGTKIIASEPKEGRRVDAEKLLAAMTMAIGGGSEQLVEAPLVVVKPTLDKARLQAAASEAQKLVAGPVVLTGEEGDFKLEPPQLANLLRVTAHQSDLSLTIDETALDAVLHTERPRLEHPPRNASFSIDRNDEVTVLPSAPGLKLVTADVARALLEAARSPNRSLPLPADRSAQPALTTEAAHGLRIKRRVSAFSTKHPCCQPRVTNIHRIAELLDGTIVRPGEVFSVNDAIGPRTARNGFVPAPTIEEGEMVDTVGGGISQFATTFFNALFHGGYDILERQPHTYWFPRYPMGHEATLSYPKPDLIFRNDTDAGVLIKCDAGDTFIRIRLYGDNGGRKVQAKVSDRIEIKKPPVELVPNPKLEPDEEKVKESGMIGWSVWVSRILTFPDGTKKEETRKVTYSPKVRRLEVHPCRIPEGEKGATGEPCPIPKDSDNESPDEPAQGAPEERTEDH